MSVQSGRVCVGGVDAGLLAIGVAEEDEAVDGLEAPLVFEELVGEPVEEFGVGGSVAAEAKVARCGNDAGAEVMMPEAVDDDSAGERVCG